MEPVIPQQPIDPLPVEALTTRSLAWIAVLIPLRALFAVGLLLARGYFVVRRRGRVAASAYLAFVTGALWLLVLTLKDRRSPSVWRKIIQEQSTR